MRQITAGNLLGNSCLRFLEKTSGVEWELNPDALTCCWKSQTWYITVCYF